MGSYFKFYIYILQLENYNLSRFLKFCIIQPYEKSFADRPVEWTAKLRLTVVLSFVFVIAFNLLLLFLFNSNGIVAIVLSLVASLSLLYLYFIPLSVVSFLLKPIDFIAKENLRSKAKRKIKQFTNLKVIGISGSYGKTTMKECLGNILSTKFKVLKTPDNINTDLGISQLILSELNESHEILLIEMGEYRPGDIKAICDIVYPNYGIITGVNEAHLERMGSLKNAVETMFELAKYSKPDAKYYLNGDDQNILDNYKNFVAENQVDFYGTSDTQGKIKVKDHQFMEDGSGQRFVLTSEDKDINLFLTQLGEIKVPILGEYIVGVMKACILFAVELSIDPTSFKRGLLAITPVKHRLQPIRSENDLLVIDDSYNGNPAGVSEAIKCLVKFKSRRKVYLTPGLVELGDSANKVHEEIGKNLGMNVDLIMLVKNSSTDPIINGIKQTDFNMDNLLVFNTREDAHASLGSVLKPNDVILFQNDLTENYL